MTDPNVNPNGQVPWQQADANPTEPLNAMTAETGTAANNAPTKQSQRASSPLKRSLLLNSLRSRLHLPSSPPSLLRRSISRYRLRSFATSDSCRCARARTGSTQFALSGGGSGRRIGSSGLRQRQCSGISGRRGRASANAL